jgi:hypothetical protein
MSAIDFTRVGFTPAEFELVCGRLSPVGRAMLETTVRTFQSPQDLARITRLVQTCLDHFATQAPHQAGMSPELSVRSSPDQAVVVAPEVSGAPEEASLATRRGRIRTLVPLHHGFVAPEFQGATDRREWNHYTPTPAAPQPPRERGLEAPSAFHAPLRAAAVAGPAPKPGGKPPLAPKSRPPAVPIDIVATRREPSPSLRYRLDPLRDVRPATSPIAPQFTVGARVRHADAAFGEGVIQNLDMSDSFGLVCNIRFTCDGRIHPVVASYLSLLPS